MQKPIECKLCSGRAVSKDGLCYNHHKERKINEWLDNTDINNLGIVKWCRELMPEFAYSETPWFHKKLFLDLLSLYNPAYRNKYERLYELISFRESAKSTAANTLFVSYILAHNGRSVKLTVNGKVVSYPIEEKTITIVSETGNSAEEFTVRIRDAFTVSERLRYYYRVQFQDAQDNITGQWTRASFKFNNCYVIAVGAGQQIRGKVKGASRPTLLIADDIYSENNVLTEERRRKIKNWWNNSVVNSIDNLNGKILVLGTILHDDTILVELEDNPQWRTTKITVQDPDKFEDFIKTYIRVDWDTSSCVLPYDEIENRDERFNKQKEFFDEVQAKRDWGLAWPERIDLYLLAIKYKEAVYNQSVDGLYQEYFHITVSPETRRFKREYFKYIKNYDLKYEFGHNWIKLGNSDKWINCNIEFGVDLSGKGLDDTVVTITAALPDLQIVILHQAIGKWSIRDDLYGDTSRHLRLNKVAMNRSAVKNIGVVDECFRLSRRYRPSKIKIGIAAEEELIVDEMRRVFEINQNYLTQIVPRPQTVQQGKKESRILSTMLRYYETRMVFHTSGLQKLEYQLEFLGRSKHDDCADSAECSFFSLEFPSDMLDIGSFNYNTQPNGHGSYIYSLHGNRLDEVSISKNWKYL